MKYTFIMYSFYMTDHVLLGYVPTLLAISLYHMLLVLLSPPPYTHTEENGRQTQISNRPEAFQFNIIR